jgi:hypothetical protein
MNVLNIISTTLAKQRSTFFQAREETRSPRSMSSNIDYIKARQFSAMNKSIILEEVRVFVLPLSIVTFNNHSVL